MFDFPEGIGPIECVNVEHEEVVLIPRWVDCRRVTFKYGLGDEFIDVLRTLHKLGLDRTDPVRVRGVDVSPRDVVAAALPEPGDARRPDARPHLRRHVRDGHRQGRTPPCAPTSTTSPTTRRRCARTDPRRWCGRPRSTPWSRSNCWPTGVWSGAGVLGPEAFDAVPFLDLLADHGSPHGVDERSP